MTHTKLEISSAIKIALGVTTNESDLALKTVIEYIASIPVGDRVEIRGFGTFERKNVTGENKHNPKTGEPVVFTPYSTLRFKPSKLLKSPSIRG